MSKRLQNHTTGMLVTADQMKEYIYCPCQTMLHRSIFSAIGLWSDACASRSQGGLLNFWYRRECIFFIPPLILTRRWLYPSLQTMDPQIRLRFSFLWRMTEHLTESACTRFMAASLHFYIMFSSSSIISPDRPLNRTKLLCIHECLVGSVKQIYMQARSLTLTKDMRLKGTSQLLVI